MKRMAFVLAAVFAVAGCTDTAGFSNRLDAFESAMNAQDVEGLVELYAEDASLMPPNMPAMTGHDAVRETFGGMIEQGITVDLNTSSFEVALGSAHRVGTYKTMAGGQVVDTGKFIETWSKDGGAWRMTNDIWNSDNPPALPPPKQKHEKKRGGMEHPHVMILHEVEDADRWFAAWRGENSRHDMFKANGARHVHTFQHPENANLTGLVVAVDDMAALEAFLASDEVQAAATEDGVRMDTLQVLPEAK